MHRLGYLSPTRPPGGPAFQAFYVDIKIFRGAHPGGLPLEQPTKFELVVNGRAAKALGLILPPAMQVRVDEVLP